MSVLNQSGEEQVECPLCMEPLEVDDLNFFPCTCGYQICRFCWHRIRLDENGGLCPACRKAYSENPADFIPLSQEQVAKLKSEKRQRDQQRKAKLTESRKHLASVRVVQRNLVFVVGLPVRLADPDVLKRHEYFGKFGKIHKVVINQSTSYAGSQGPSASAYVTYIKSDDALRAIQNVNNITIDNRVIKSSLGTTKYCSHFMKNQPCPKADCMYLHEYGDPEASFTKEQMHAGKHQEYEKKLHEELLAKTKQQNNNNTTIATDTKNAAVTTSTNQKPKDTVTTATSGNTSGSSSPKDNGTNKENWPNLDKEKKEKEKGKKAKTKSESSKRDNNKREVCNSRSSSESKSEKDRPIKNEEKEELNSTSPSLSEPEPLPPPSESHLIATKLPSLLDDSSSFFSTNTFQKITAEHRQEEQETETDNTDSETTQHSTILTDTLPNINTTEDWAAAFGFARHSDQQHIDNRKQRLDAFGSNFGSMGHENGFNKGVDTFNGFYDVSKMENIMDVLSNKTNGLSYKHDAPQTPSTTHNMTNGINGLDQNMSKFFNDFHNKYNKDMSPGYPNGFNGMHNGYQQGLQNHLLLQQKQLEEQLVNFSLKQGYGGASPSIYQNGMTAPPYINGDATVQQNSGNGFGGMHGMYGGVSVNKDNSRNSEAELDFDPFQETQKALAELMANEQNRKSHSTGRGSQINGVIHTQNGGHLPPPPPGFVQPPNTHMNSFGSKILPFLNMSNSQQINGSTQNNWPSSFSPQIQQQQQQQQKNINNTCNDWKVLDPAILSSSRNFQLTQLPPLRDHFSNLPPLGTQQIQQNGGPPRSFDYTNNTFSNFTQLPPNFNNFTHINSQPNVNWYSSELNSQISSPPGFRNNQTSKQQEC